MHVVVARMRAKPGRCRDLARHPLETAERGAADAPSIVVHSVSIETFGEIVEKH